MSLPVKGKAMALVSIGHYKLLVTQAKAQVLMSALQGAIEVEYDFEAPADRYQTTFLIKGHLALEVKTLAGTWSSKVKPKAPAPKTAPQPAPAKATAPEPASGTGAAEALCVCGHPRSEHPAGRRCVDGDCECGAFLRDGTAASRRPLAVQKPPAPEVQEAQFVELKAAVTAAGVRPKAETAPPLPAPSGGRPPGASWAGPAAAHVGGEPMKELLWFSVGVWILCALVRRLVRWRREQIRRNSRGEVWRRHFSLGKTSRRYDEWEGCE